MATLTWPVVDAQERFIKPIQDIDWLLDYLGNQKKSIIDKDTHPVRMSMLGKDPGSYSDIEKKYAPLNPEVVQDRARLGKIDNAITKLQNQKGTLAKDYMDFYGTALDVGQKTAQWIQRQTDNLLKGSAIEEARQRGFALGESSGRWDTQAMQQKVINDIASKGAQDRSDILARQGALELQNQGNQQSLLTGIGEDLRNQYNIEQQVALSQQSARGGGWGSRGGSGWQYDPNQYYPQFKDGKNWLVRFDSRGNEVERIEVDATGNPILPWTTNTTNTRWWLASSSNTNPQWRIPDSYANTLGGALLTAAPFTWPAAPWVAGAGGVVLAADVLDNVVAGNYAWVAGNIISGIGWVGVGRWLGKLTGLFRKK